jgi:hypothetical protein
MTHITSYVRSTVMYSSARVNATKIISLYELKVGFLVNEVVYNRLGSFIYININYELS